MRTFVTAPQAEGNWPGIVFYTDIFQLTEASLRWAVRLAAYGFLVAVPEIYHRVEPPDTVLAFDDEGKARGQADVEAITTAEFDEDIDAALTWLAARGAPVGASGHCTGGHLGFRAAFDGRVSGTALVSFFREECRVNATKDDRRPSVPRERSNLVPSKRVAGVNPDADDIARLDLADVERFQCFVGNARSAM